MKDIHVFGLALLDGRKQEPGQEVVGVANQRITFDHLSLGPRNNVEMEVIQNRQCVMAKDREGQQTVVSLSQVLKKLLLSGGTDVVDVVSVCVSQ